MGGGAGIIFIYIILFVGVFYVLAIRPQRRQRQAHAQMLAMLKKGDEVVTFAGIFGVVKQMRDDYVVLEIANRVRVRCLKRAISQIVSEEEEEEDYEEYEEEEEEYEEEEPDELEEAEDQELEAAHDEELEESVDEEVDEAPDEAAEEASDSEEEPAPPKAPRPPRAPKR
jgi:preprotein translocase subunit YajC